MENKKIEIEEFPANHLIKQPGNKFLWIKIKHSEVLVVHAIDTEGPLYESLEAKFDRLNDF